MPAQYLFIREYALNHIQDPTVVISSICPKKGYWAFGAPGWMLDFHLRYFVADGSSCQQLPVRTVQPCGSGFTV